MNSNTSSAMDWSATEADVADTKEFAVLNFLASRVDEENKVAFPGVNIISGKTKMSDRSVIRALSAMLERGLISKDFQYIRLGVGMEALPAPERKRRITYIGRGDHNLSKKVRHQILERDGNTCTRCPSTEDLTVDHIYPWSLGGSNDPSNLRVLCRSCNSSKGNKIEVQG